MESEILVELKKINAQLAQLITILAPSRGERTPKPSQDIGSEVQRRIAEARHKAQITAGEMQHIK